MLHILVMFKSFIIMTSILKIFFSCSNLYFKSITGYNNIIVSLILHFMALYRNWEKRLVRLEILKPELEGKSLRKMENIMSKEFMSSEESEFE